MNSDVCGVWRPQQARWRHLQRRTEYSSTGVDYVLEKCWSVWVYGLGTLVDRSTRSEQASLISGRPDFNENSLIRVF